MNNRKVDQSSERISMERSLDKRKTNDTTVIADYSNQMTRPGIASKIANLKHERLDKSPVMKYLSISLVKKNIMDSSTSETSTIKFHNHKSKEVGGMIFVKITKNLPFT